MTTWSLLPHPDFPSVAVDAIHVNVVREGGALELAYRVEGNIAGMVWPRSTETGRSDGLWRSTCFEAFVQPEGSPGYTELNFAPSGRWAAYAFDGYRAGMRDFEGLSGELLRRALATDDGDRVRTWYCSTLDVLGRQPWRLGLTVVVEATDGSKSYWALAHAPGKPDFHNADCFTARLAAPERA